MQGKKEKNISSGIIILTEHMNNIDENVITFGDGCMDILVIACIQSLLCLKDNN